MAGFVGAFTRWQASVEPECGVENVATDTPFHREKTSGDNTATRSPIARKPRYQVIDRPNTLIQKLNGPEVGVGVIDPQAIARAEQAIEQSRDRYIAQASQHLENMRAALKTLSKQRKDTAAPLQELYRYSREMKGQAATFGFLFLTRFGDSLAELTQKMTLVTDRQIELINAHLNAMDVVITQQVTGTGGMIGEELSDGLRRAIQRVVAENRR